MLELWYKKFSKNKAVRLTVIIFFIVISLGAFYQGVSLLFGIPGWVSGILNPNDGSYANLAKIDTGLQHKYIESLIGSPISSQALPGEFDSYRHSIYKTDNHLLKIVFDKDDRSVFYSVTTLNEKFNPLLPIPLRSENENLELGVETFKDVAPLDYIQGFYAGNNSQYLFYEEQYYFGRPGLYKFYYLSSSPSSGVGRGEDIQLIFDIIASQNSSSSKPSKIRWGFVGHNYRIFTTNPTVPREVESVENIHYNLNKHDLSESVIKIRESLRPNTYAVSEAWLDDELLGYLFISNNGIGVEYFKSIDMKN